MTKILRKLGALFLSAALLASLVVSAAAAPAASGKTPPPTQVSATYRQQSIGVNHVYLNFGQDEATKAWLNALSGLTVGGVTYTKSHTVVFQEKAWTVSQDTGAADLPLVVKLTENFGSPAELVLSANGYQDLKLTLTKSGSGTDTAYTGTIAPAGGGERPEPGTAKTIALDQIVITDDGGVLPAYHWYVGFKRADGYAAAVTQVTVNGNKWEKKSSAPNLGGAYAADAGENRLVFAIDSFGGGTPTLKSGDVVTISATDYQDLTFKFVLDKNGKNPQAEAADGQGDHYALHAKLVGSFEAAVVGQKDYDGVSGATGSVSVNKNSSVTVYGALVEKGTQPAESDWKELKHGADGIDIDGSKCAVSIAPDTAKGTPENRDSGMRGVYLTLSSSLTLSGTPKDPGHYLVSITVTDRQGRTATSNALPFRVYTGEETLADQLKLENLKQTQDGKHMWDIMEPWAIKNFGSNVEGKQNSVRVPQTLKAWYGSHTSGTYGVLGYDIPWKQVTEGDIPQTLYIPKGCDLTLVNMKVLSSVRIVVEEGGKLTLRDSVVQGVIDVEGGGAFSMNYNGFGQGAFLTGASLCGQLRLQDGAILENAAIYSNTNYLANGQLTDRTNSEPVVVTNGNVTVRGQVFIRGDEAGDGVQGQPGLRVQKGTLTVEDGATLVVYGGDAKVQPYAAGGTAIQLDQGTITGGGTVVAVGGRTLFGNGGTGVTGQGTISTQRAFLQGATACGKAQAGKALEGTISVTSASRHVKDGTVVQTAAPDPLEELYWKSGIEPTPPLDAIPMVAVHLTADPAALDFGTRTQGYGPKPQTVTIRNTGRQAVTLTQPVSSTRNFEVGNLSTTSLPVNGTVTFTVQPKAGLRAGTYRETIVVSGANDGHEVSVSIPVQFAVEKKAAPTYAITLLPSDNGTLTCYARGAEKGATVTVKVKPQGGYHLDKLVVTDAKGNVLAVKQESYGTYTFVMPASTVTVEGVFVKNTPETLPFSDVKPTDWFYNSVKYVYEKDLMDGVEGGKFAPNATLNRAMLVTILYRLDGQPAVSGDLSFADVPAGTWYTNAVKWAADNGIVKGVEDNQFAPTDGLTREQMAAMLCRYAQHKKLDVSASADLTAFVDGEKTSPWAADAMKWAVGSGLINGLEGNTLAPQATSTRAQVAAVLMRFCENVVK